MEAMSYAMVTKKNSDAGASHSTATTSSIASGLRISEVNDSFEQEADRVADQVISGRPPQHHWSLPVPSVGGALQRKCSCGGSGGSGGECEQCKQEKEDQTLQRKAAAPAPAGVAPPIVHEVLNSPGRRLDPDTRNFFEPRFGRDFSKVRIYADGEAAASARAVHARAYTVGPKIVFGTGEYRPQSEAGRRLIAHELAHTLQQRPMLARQPMEPPRDSPSPAPGGPSTLPQSPAAKTASSTSVPQLPARGPNPADCMKPLCQKISTLPTPTTDDKAVEMGNNWSKGALACVDGGAAASNASHSAEIAANEDGEISDEAKVLNDDFRQQKPRPGRRQDYVKNLLELCQHKQREVYLEFFYNVIFENPARATPKWGYNPDWDQVDAALSELPIEATWGNPRLLRFNRAACHPDDVDKTTGQCKTSGKLTGGETSPPTGGVNQITVFDAGVGQSPYSRSKSLRLPATSQTIRHEVGHVIDQLLSPADRNDFFENIVHWHIYPWDWIMAHGTGVPKEWQNERNRLIADTGINDSQLDTWLNGLAPQAPVTVKGMVYFKRPIGSQSFELNAFPQDQVPQGVEFEYARTSHEDYFAELYTLAVSRPEFLSSALPPEQSAWLRRVVFHTPEDPKALAKQAALAEPELTEFLVRGSKLYTREQLEALLNEILIRKSNPGSQMG